jgi:hypothetical protein
MVKLVQDVAVHHGRGSPAHYFDDLGTFGITVHWSVSITANGFVDRYNKLPS